MVVYRAKNVRIVSMSQYLWTWLYIYIYIYIYIYKKHKTIIFNNSKTFKCLLCTQVLNIKCRPTTMLSSPVCLMFYYCAGLNSLRKFCFSEKTFEEIFIDPKFILEFPSQTVKTLYRFYKGFINCSFILFQIAKDAGMVLKHQTIIYIIY